MSHTRRHVVTLALLVSALAVRSAWAGSTGARHDQGAAPAAAVDRLDVELARELSATGAPTTVPSEGDVLAEARDFYRGLESAPAPPSRPAQTGTQRAPHAEPAVLTATPAPAVRLLSVALKYEGVPYVWGGASKKGVDCSGLVVKAAAELGHPLPHSAALIYQHGTPVPRDQLQPGDLVFFANTYKPGISHVGIFAGGSRFLQASSGHGKVTFGNLSSAYYQRKYAGARRLPGLVDLARSAVSLVKGAGRKVWSAFALGAPSG